MKPMARRIRIIAILFLLFGIPYCGHLVARYHAIKFGQTMAASYSSLGRKSFADTAALRSYFASPEVAGHVRTVEKLSLFNSDYEEWIHDLQAGLIYYSEQASLPHYNRLAEPPQLQHLTIDINDPSEEGLAKASANLITSYLRRFQ